MFFFILLIIVFLFSKHWLVLGRPCQCHEKLSRFEPTRVVHSHCSCVVWLCVSGAWSAWISGSVTLVAVLVSLVLSSSAVLFSCLVFAVAVDPSLCSFILMFLSFVL